MEFQHVANGIWRVRFGVPESQTPVSLRKFAVKTEGLNALLERELPAPLRELRCRHTRRGMVITLPMDSCWSTTESAKYRPGA